MLISSHICYEIKTNKKSNILFDKEYIQLSTSLEKIVIDLIGLFRPHLEGITSIIDIGTGTSIPIHVIAENFAQIKYNTVDVVDMRKRRKLPFMIYDGKNLPFDDLEFDVSLLNETLHHCKDPQSVLNEARRVALSVYVIEHFPNPNASIKELIESENYSLNKFGIDCPIYNPFTDSSLYLLFENVGLKILDKIEVPYYGNRKIRKYFFKLK